MLGEVALKKIEECQAALYAKRKAEADPTGELEKKSKGKSAAKSKKSLAKKSKPDDETEGEEAVEEDSHISEYPETLPLHILLDGIINTRGDVERLAAHGIVLDAFVQFKTAAQKRADEANDPDAAEFLYGDPLADAQLDPQDSRPKTEAKTTASGGDTPAVNMPPAIEEGDDEDGGPAKNALATDLQVLCEEDPLFRDLSILTVVVPDADDFRKDPLLGTLAPVVTEEAEEEDQSGKGKGKDKKVAAKDAKAGKKEAKKADSEKDSLGRQVFVAGNGLELIMRDLSERKALFEQWKENVPVENIPEANLEENVDMRLYDNLLAKVPDPCVSVHLLLYCLFEQVAVTAAGADLADMFTEQKAEALSGYLDQAFNRVQLDQGANIGKKTAGELALEQAEELRAQEDEEDEKEVGLHQFRAGLCVSCGEPEFLPLPPSDDQNEVTEKTVQRIGPPPPIFEGDPVPERDPAISIRHAASLKVLQEAAEGAPQLSRTETLEEGDCPATMGEPHSWTDNVCDNCGIPAEKAYSQQQQLPATASSGAPTIEPLAEFCPATIGEGHVFGGDGMCENCGDPQEGIATFPFDASDLPKPATATSEQPDDYTRPASGANAPSEVPSGMERNLRPCPAALGAQHSTVVLDYGEFRGRVVAEAALFASREDLSSHPLQDTESALVREDLGLPGVGELRRGLPSVPTHSTAQRGFLYTELLNSSQVESDQLDRALLCLHFQDMLSRPAPSYRHTARDREGTFHLDSAAKDSAEVEAAIVARLSELKETYLQGRKLTALKSDKEAGSDGGTSVYDQQRDPADGLRLFELLRDIDSKRDWSLGDRCYREELDSKALPQVLARAIYSSTLQVAETQARYHPMGDELLVTVATETPLLRAKRTVWREFRCPSLTLPAWTNSSVNIRSTRPPRMYNFAHNYNGHLMQSSQSFYPRDQAVLGWTRSNSGLQSEARLWCEFEGHLVQLQPDTGSPEQIAQEAAAMLLSARFDDGSRFLCRGSTKHMKASYTTALGLLVDITADGSVTMRYPSKVDNKKAKQTDDERWRCVTPSGCVLRRLEDGTTQVLMPDGNMATQAGPDEDWFRTNSRGERVQVSFDGTITPLQDVLVARQVDAETSAVVHTREDLVMTVEYRDGSSLAQHADGTRIYFDRHCDGTDPRRFQIECPGFAPITIEKCQTAELRADGQVGLLRSERTVVKVDLPDGAQIEKRVPQGSVTVIAPGRPKLICSAHNQALMVSTVSNAEVLRSAEAMVAGRIEPESIPWGTYLFDLSENGGIRTSDEEDNLFELSLRLELESKTLQAYGRSVLGRHRGIGAGEEHSIPAKFYAPPENPLQPRLFVVRADGSGYELLHNSVAEQYIEAAEQNEKVTMLPPEPLGNTSETSLKFLHRLEKPNAYRIQPVLPSVIKATPSGLGDSSPSKHDVVVFRHLIKNEPLPQNVLTKVQADRDALRERMDALARRDELDAVAFEDPRTEQEQLEAQRIAMEVVHARKERQARHNRDNEFVSVKELQAHSEMERAELAATLQRGVAEVEKHALQVEESLKQQNNWRYTEPPAASPPATFFTASKPGSKPPSSSGRRSGPRGRRPASRRSEADQPMSDTSSFSSDGDLMPYFQNAVRSRSFAASQLLRRMIAESHPFNKGDEDGNAALSSTWSASGLNSQQRALVHQDHCANAESMMQAVSRLLSCVGRVLTNPHDPTLRTINLELDPYSELCAANSVLGNNAGALLALIGFVPENGQLCLMQDDMYLRGALGELENAASVLLDELRLAPVVSEEEQKEEANGDDLQHTARSEIDQLDGEYGGTVSSFPVNWASGTHGPSPDAKRLMQRTAPQATHDRFGASFVESLDVGAGDGKLFPRQHARTYIPPVKSLEYTVTGERRQNKVQLPRPLQPVAKGQVNQHYVMAERSARLPTKTSSTVRLAHQDLAGFAHFAVQPVHVQMGEIQLGHTYRATVSLVNTSSEKGRFKVLQPSNSGGNFVHAMYQPGPLAPGLKRRVEVEMYATQMGDIRSELIVQTEKMVYRLPISARVVPTDVSGRPSAKKRSSALQGNPRIHCEGPSSSAQAWLKDLGIIKDEAARVQANRQTSADARRRRREAEQAQNKLMDEIEGDTVTPPTKPEGGHDWQVDHSMSLKQLQTQLMSGGGQARV